MEVLPAHRGARVPVHAVYSSRAATRPTLAAFLQALEAHLARAPLPS